MRLQKSRRFLILSFLFLASCFFTNAYSFNTINKEDNAIRFVDYPGILLTLRDSVSPDSILKYSFTPEKNYFLNLGFKKENCWIKLQVQNSNTHIVSFFIDLQNKYLEYIDVYVFSRNQQIENFRGGCKIAQIFPLKITASALDTLTILVKVKSRSPLRIPIQLFSIDELYQFKSRTGILNGIYYGIFILIFIVMLYAVVQFKDKLNIYLLFNVFFSIIFHLAYDNYIPLVKWKGEPDILIRIATSLVPAIYYCYIGFTGAFFNINKNSYKYLLKLFKYIAIFHFITFLFNYHLGNRITYLGFPLLSITLLSVSLYLWLVLKKKYIRLYVFATFLLLSGVILHLLANFGVFTNIYISLYSFKTGYLLQIIIYLIAVTERYIFLQRNFTEILELKVNERTVSLENVNQELRKVNNTITRYQVHLEDVVKERTAELENSTRSMQTLINNSPLAIFDVDTNGNILTVWNAMAEKIFEKTAQEAIGNPLPELDSFTPDITLQLFNRVLMGETITYVELKRKHRNNSEISLRISMVPILNNQNHTERIIVFIDNITDRKKLRDAIIESESKFRALFLSSRIGIVFYQGDFRIVDMNPAFVKLTGKDFSELIMEPFPSIIHETYHDNLYLRLNSLQKKESVGNWEFELKHKDGALISVEGFDSTVELGGKTFYVSIILDITERRQYQQKIFESIIQTEENERRRFAGDLHDDLGPYLASMRLYASSLKKRTTDSEMQAIVEELMEIIKKSISSVRELSHNLSPHLLENYGLTVAIKAETDRISNFVNIELDQNIEKLRFEKNIEIVVYRICKELINNTLKYAEATLITLQLRFDNNVLIVKYSDNGKGFDFDNYMKTTSKGLGILNIISRISSLNGNCKFFSEPNKGFLFETKINIPKH